MNGNGPYPVKPPIEQITCGATRLTGQAVRRGGRSSRDTATLPRGNGGQRGSEAPTSATGQHQQRAGPRGARREPHRTLNAEGNRGGVGYQQEPVRAGGDRDGVGDRACVGGGVVTAPAARRYEAGLDAARAGLPCPNADPAARRGGEKAGRDAARAEALARRVAPVLGGGRRA